jgi:hypothetical protein
VLAEPLLTVLWNPLENSVAEFVVYELPGLPDESMSGQYDGTGKGLLLVV